MSKFKKMAKPYEENAILALQEFVKKDSVYDASSIEENAPYGKGVKSALDYLAKLGKEYGFEVDTCKGRATEISFGENGPLVGIYAHSDVVPVSGKWDVPAFSGKIVGEGKEAKIISRGATDDKGPLIASLFAMKMLKDNGLIDGYRVRLVAGGDEERGSSCLRYYFGELKKPHADYAFTPDADFPLIYAEKGIIHGTLKKKIDLSPIINMDGGVVSNAVCDKLVVTLPSDKKLISFLKGKGVSFDSSDLGQVSLLTFKGKSAHGSTPELGENAALKAFELLGDYYHIDALSRLALTLSDPNGRNFDGYEHSPELGDTTYNYGLISYDSKGMLSLSVDFRFGEGVDGKAKIEKLKEKTGFDFTFDSESKVLLHDKKSPLVSTLMKSYKRMTHHFFDKPLAIGGGTYAKEAKNCVAYGPTFPIHPGDIHSPNEYIYLNEFKDLIAIYADAIYSLGKIKK